MYGKVLFCVHSLREASRKGAHLCQINVLQRNALGVCEVARQLLTPIMKSPYRNPNQLNHHNVPEKMYNRTTLKILHTGLLKDIYFRGCANIGPN